MAFGPVSVGSAPYTLPAATASTLGGIKAGKNITIAADGTASAPDPYTLTSDKIAAALGYAPASAASAAQLPYSITYEGSYVGTARRQDLFDKDDPNYATETNPVRTTLSKEYDIVVFLDAGKDGKFGVSSSETCPEKKLFLYLMNVNDKFVDSYVVMSALTNEWTRGLSRDQSKGDVAYGPVIEYNVSPKKNIKYRKNGTSIERYWTRESITPSGSLGKPGSADYLSNGAYMLLDKSGVTYHVFGIDIDHRIFVPAQTAAEGEDTV